MSSSTKIDNRKKDNLIFGKSPTQGYEKNWLKGYVYEFSTDYNHIPVSDILDIHKHLMEKNKIIVQIYQANICFNTNVFW